MDIPNRNTYEKIQRQAYKSVQVAGCLNATIWHNKYMSREGKVRTYKSMVRPVLIYVIETCAEIKIIEQKVGVK